MTHRFRSAVLLVALVALSSAVGCGETRRPGRVLLVGVDGASPRVVVPMLRAGRLPHFADLAKRGVHGTLRSQHPIDSPPVWNTIVTGMPPRLHGIPSFAYKGKDGKKHLYLSTDRKVPAIWNILSHAGFKVGVVDFWNTYPPDRIDGVMISDHILSREIEGRALITHAPPPHVGSTVYPVDWADRIEALLDDKTPLTNVPDPFRGNTALPKWAMVDDLSQRYAEDQALTRITLAIEHDVKPDLLMVLLPGIDRIQHHLWGTLEPPELYPPRLRPSPTERAAGVAAIWSYYDYTDQLLGLLMADYGPDDLVMVVSDHGFEAGTALMYLTGKHETDKAIEGIFFAAGRGVGPPGGDSQGASVKDVTPTLLAWFGQPVSDEMEGRPLPFFEASRDVRHVASYRDVPIEKVTAEPSGAEADIIERLRALGYLEKPGGPPPQRATASQTPEEEAAGREPGDGAGAPTPAPVPPQATPSK